MNLIEAVKSGDNFRRESWRSSKLGMWRMPLHLTGDKIELLTKEDILADDWETKRKIEEKAVTITQSQILRIARLVWEEDFSFETRRCPDSFTLKLAQRLGLGEE